MDKKLFATLSALLIGGSTLFGGVGATFASEAEPSEPTAEEKALEEALKEQYLDFDLTVDVQAPVTLIDVEMPLSGKIVIDADEVDSVLSPVFTFNNQGSDEVEIIFEDSNTGEVTLVAPNHFTNWLELTAAETATHLALGMSAFQSGDTLGGVSHDATTHGAWKANSPILSNDIYLDNTAVIGNIEATTNASFSFVAEHGIAFPTNTNFNADLYFVATLVEAAK